jgi:hypothetical protein
VFDDLLVSYPPLPATDDVEPLSPWLKASVENGAEMISTRYEHTAILSKQGECLLCLSCSSFDPGQIFLPAATGSGTSSVAAFRSLTYLRLSCCVDTRRNVGHLGREL